MEKCEKKRLILLGIIALILYVSAFSFCIIYKNYKIKNEVKVFFSSDLNFEVNSQVNYYSLVSNVVNGNIIDGEKIIDTSSVGVKKIEISVKNKKGKVKIYDVEVNIKDTTAPIIEANSFIVLNVNTSTDLLKKAIVSDNSGKFVELKVVGDYSLTKAGQYKLKYEATDIYKNSSTYDFILVILNETGDTMFTTDNGFVGSIIDGVTYIDGVLVANKTYSLPSNYGSELTKETMDAFNLMKQDASLLDLNLYIASGYRSYSTQQILYNNYVKRDGVKEADTYSARPGHSEHQTGLAFDLNSVNSSFADTLEGKWVVHNCHKYGFIIRYPKNKSDITGYMYEPWHLRYVGKELAQKLYNNGDWITLEEYFGIDSTYDKKES